MRKYLFFIAGFIFFISGCGGGGPAYREIFDEKPFFNSRMYPVSMDILYPAVVNAVFGKHFSIEKEKEEEDNGFILAKRCFSRGKETVTVVLQARVTEQGDNSRLELNAFESSEKVYIADRRRFFLFIVPLPGGGGQEATKVKEGEKTIKDRRFYRSFFEAVEEQIPYISQE